MTSSRNTRGYIALISVLTMSAFIVVSIATVGITSWLARADRSDADLRSQSRYFAESCLRVAALRVAQDAAYAFDTPACEPVGDLCPGESNCVICSVSNAFPKLVIVQGAYRGAYTTLEAIVDEDHSIRQVRELPLRGACAIH